MIKNIFNKCDDNIHSLFEQGTLRRCHYAIAILLYLTILQTAADFEQHCQARDYTNYERSFPRRMNRCVSGLARFIVQNCEDTTDDLPRGYSKTSFQRGQY